MSDNNNNGTDKWRQRELGALWKRQSNDGTKTFLTGKINGKKVVVFSNADRKKKKLDEGANQEDVDRLPDFTIYESEEQQQGGGNTQPARPAAQQTRRPQGNTTRPAARPQGRPAPPRPAAPATTGPLGEDDVPY